MSQKGHFFALFQNWDYPKYLEYIEFNLIFTYCEAAEKGEVGASDVSIESL